MESGKFKNSRTDDTSGSYTDPDDAGMSAATGCAAAPVK